MQNSKEKVVVIRSASSGLSEAIPGFSLPKAQAFVLGARRALDRVWAWSQQISSLRQELRWRPRMCEEART